MKLNAKQYVDQMINKLQSSIKNKFYNKTEVDELVSNVEVDTSALATKEELEEVTNLSTHENREIIDKFSQSEDGNLLFDGKGIEPDTSNLVVKSELEDVKENYLSKEVFQGNEKDSVKYADNLTTTKKRQPLQYYGTDSNNELGLHYLPINMKDNTGMEQRVCLKAQENVDIIIDSLKDINDNKLIIDCYKFTSTEKDIMSTIKTFNNSEKDNFFFNKESVEFTESMHIKKNHILESKLNEDGVYESEIINKDNFFEILGIEGDI